MSSEKIQSARDRIIDVAGPLFYREGYRAIGVDRLIAEASVAKATFYKHFPAKDDLIVAWIEKAESAMNANLPPADGPSPLFAYVDHMIDVAHHPSCLGCTFQGTAAEFKDEAHPAHAAAIKIKNRTLAEIELRARNQKAKHPRKVAELVYLLIEGVWVSVRMFGNKAPIAHVKEAVRKLME
ncbi:MAG: TetR/AcrR family transcriptional regulator [Alphaproteobacteria bacterium]|nr:TetR/AcrR family transcriptional regulator [Alphaproteobacteria bacterium]